VAFRGGEHRKIIPRTSFSPEIFFQKKKVIDFDLFLAMTVT